MAVHAVAQRRWVVAATGIHGGWRGIWRVYEGVDPNLMDLA
jgi:hypothetical protein